MKKNTSIPLALGALVLLLVSIIFHSSIVQAFAVEPPQDGDDFPDVGQGQLPQDYIPPGTPPGATTDVSSQYVNTDGSTVGYRTWSTQLNVGMWYAWNRDLGGTLYPSSDSQTSGYATALSDPNITIGYDFGVFDASNPTVRIPEGSTVPQGSQVLLKFAPYTPDNIFWFGTGSSMDSPFGEWRLGASAPPRSDKKVTCQAKDLTAQSTVFGLGFDVYIPLVVDPPSRTLSNTGGLTCGPLTTNVDKSQSALCTVTGSGTINPTFNYDSTFGKFYYRYYDYRNTNEVPVGWGGAGCYGNNIPLTSAFGIPAGPDANLVTQIQTPYSLSIPSQAYAYPITVGAAGNAKPATPTMNCPSSVGIGQDVSVTLSATDPDNDTVQYATDWIDDATIDPNSGWTALVPSGTPQTLTKNGGYSQPGSVKIYGFARDSNGAMATPPASCTINVTAPSTPNLTAGLTNPSSATTGQPVQITSTVYNVAPASTGSPFTDLLQSATDPGGSNAQDIGTYSNPSIGSNSQTNVSFTHTFPSSGTFYVRVCADKSSAGDSGVIAESNENDNCGGWSSISVSGPVLPPTPPTCSLTAGASSLTWSSTDATSCTGGGFSTGNATSGGPIPAAPGPYTLQCVGPGGQCTDSASVAANTCTGDPLETITATPNRVRAGETTTISWGATNVPGANPACTVSGPGVSRTYTAGTPPTCSIPNDSATPVITTQSIYTITCAGTSKSVTVNVLPEMQEF